MSHPRYNPFAPGKQISQQGQYRGAGGQMQRDPRRLPSLLGLDPSFSSSGSSSVNCGPTGGAKPPLLPLPVNFRPDRKETAAEGDAGRRLDCRTGRARDEAVQNFASQNSQFTNVQRDTYPSSNRGRSSYLTAPATQEKRPFTVDSGSSSLDWASAEESSNLYSSASSSFRSSAVQSKGGQRDYETSLSDKTGPPAEAVHPKYTSESASNILLHFGLQREDLEHLTAYPEDQLTPENLPFILRQIRLEKAERTQTAVQSKPYDEPLPTRHMDAPGKSKASRGPVLDPDEITSQVLKTSKVIDYGHTSQSELASFGPLGEDSDLRQLEPKVPKTLPSKKPAPAHQATSKPNLIRGVHPGRPGLVLIGSNDASGANNQKRAGETPSKGPKKKKTQPQQKQQLHMQQQLQMQQQMQQQLQMQQQPTQPQDFPATRPTPLLLIPTHPTRAMRGPNQRDAMTGVGVSTHEPTPAMMQDYTAATPRIFPHTCCLCMKECTSLKDWLAHQNTPLHLENCQLLRTRYSEWDGWNLDFLSSPGEATQPAPSTLSKNVQNRQQKSVRETLSRSPSPHRQRGSEDRRRGSEDRRRGSEDRRRGSEDRRRGSEDRRRGSEDRKEKQDRREKRFSPYRSRSPNPYHASESRRERQRSRSWSSDTSRHSFRSRSRSYDRTTSSYRRSRSSSYEKRRQRREREAAARRIQESRKLAKKRSSPLRGREKRWSPERSESRRRRSRSADRLAKRLLERTAVQSRSQQADLEAMVKSLAPVLLAELENLKSSTVASSSSSSKTEKKSSISKSTKATSSRQKSGTSFSTKTTVSRSTSSSNVSLSSVYGCLSYKDIVTAMEKFGKVKSVILFRSTKQARVQFEKEEDAKKLQSLETYQVKGFPVVVDGPMGTVSKKVVLTKEPKAAPTKMSAKADTTKGKKQSEPTAGKLVTKAKVLVSKAKGVSVKQATKTVKMATATGNDAGKSVAIKMGASAVPKSKIPGKPQADKAKKPVIKKKPAGANAKSAAAPKQASKVTKQSNTTSLTTKPQPTITADPVSIKASSEVEPSAASRSESSAEESAEAQKTKTHAAEKQNQSTNKTERQQDSVQMETEMSSVNVTNEPSPRETGTSADRQNSPAGSATTSSAGDPGTKAADHAQMDENVFKELTAAIQKHRLAKQASSESKDEESTTHSRTTQAGKQKNTQPSKDEKQGKVSLQRFDQLDFSSGDFVTVDEVNEDMDNAPSSSKLTTREQKDGQSSAARKSSTGSASSLSKSTKGSQSPRSTPVSTNKKKSLSEPKESDAKEHKTCLTGQKAQSNKKEPSSSGQDGRSSETSVKLSVKDQEDKKVSEQAKSDHKASVESCAANGDEAESNSDSSAKMDVSAEGQVLQETNMKDETVKETNTSKAKEKKTDTDGKSPDKECGDENKKILDSLSRKTDEQQNLEDDQDKGTETQTPELEQDQILHQGEVQVESTDNNKGQSDECDEMEVSGQLQDGTKDQAAAAVDRDDGPSRMEKDKSSENQETPVWKDEARTKEIKTEKEGKSIGDCLVVVYDVLDATKDDLVPKTSAAEGSGKRRSTRGNKKLEKASAPVEEPKPDIDEGTFTVLDSVEEERPVVTRSTRGRRQNATKKVEENTQKRDDKTPTKRQRTPAKDSKEKDGEKTPKTEVCVLPNESRPTKKGEMDSSKETDGMQGEQPTKQEPRRGRPRKDNKTSKKQNKPEGQSVHQSLDSLKDEFQEREGEGTEEMAANVSNVSSLDQTPQAALGKESPKTKDETAAAAIDDLLNQGEASPAELKKGQAAEPEDGRSVERETMEHRSRSGGDGGGSGEMVRDGEQNREDVEMVEEAASKSEILNEIGVKAELEATTCEGTITEEDPQDLVAENKVAEKEEDQKEERGALEAQAQEQESQQENLSALDEGGQNQSKKTDEEDTMQASSSSKRKKNDNTDVEEGKPEPSGPEAKRSRSQSPSVPVDLQLPPFNPQNPLGEEFVVPKSGFFCNLCSVFYLNESTAKKVHCGSRKHYDNLLKHYKKLRQETGGADQSVQDAL